MQGWGENNRLVPENAVAVIRDLVESRDFF